MPPQSQMPSSQVVTPEAFISYIKSLPLDFQPGQGVLYSNSGYAVLGYLIERISGHKYADFLRQNIFDPLGMADSGFDTGPARMAVGYVLDSRGIVPAPRPNLEAAYSAGGLYSTTHDLLRWQRALYEGKLLSSGSLKKMTTKLKDGPGLGIGIEKYKGQAAYTHAGGIDGFASELTYFPESRTSVIILGNVAGIGASNIYYKLVPVAFGENVVLPTERQAIILPPEELAAISGVYDVALD